MTTQRNADQRMHTPPVRVASPTIPDRASAPLMKRANGRRQTWPRHLASRLVVSDFAVISLTFLVYGALFLPSFDRPLAWRGPYVPLGVVLILVGLVWLVGLAVFDTRDYHIIGHGITEYQRVTQTGLLLFTIMVMLAFFFRIELPRSMLVFAVPAGTLLLMFSRWLWRQWLRRKQAMGTWKHRAIVLGERSKAAHIVHTVRSTDTSGYEIVGVVTWEKASNRPLDGDVPVLGHYDDTERIVDEVDADTVIYVGADHFSPDGLRRLGWALADRDVDWAVAPALTDVAGPRIHARPMSGLPLIHISYPVMEGFPQFTKRAFDIVGSGLLILLFSPILIAVGLAVKLTSKGPMLYTQERIGRGGTPFKMIKFRSMVTGADDQLASLLDLQGASDRPLFKVQSDPRITPVGRVIRKYSLDELPQLLNVFKGEMSLVGPRPQRPAEVALYDDAAYRRLLVKPGMSGLWQVSGRSSLPWEESLRLDLYYVENWSFTQDLVILFRTFRAVVAPGADAH